MRFRVALARYILPISLLVLTVTCAHEDPAAPRAAAPAQATAIEITPGSVTAVVGDSIRLAAGGVGANGEAAPLGSVAWSSSSNGIATVSPDGLLRALAPGQTTITATSGVLSARAVVTVTAAAPAFVEISPSELTLNQGESTHLTATVRDGAGNRISVAVTWKTSDQSRAVVDQTGLLLATAPGAVAVTATIGAAAGTAAILVNASKSTTVSINRAEIGGVGLTLRTATNQGTSLGSGAASATLSTEVPQFVFAVDGNGDIRGMALSSVANHAVTVKSIDAASTAVGLLFPSPVIGSLRAGATDTTLIRLLRLRSFDALRVFLAGALPSRTVADVMNDPTTASLVQQVLSDYQSGSSSTFARLSSTGTGGICQSFSAARSFPSLQQSSDVLTNRSLRVVSVWQRDLDASGRELKVQKRIAALNGEDPLSIGSLLGLIGSAFGGDKPGSGGNVATQLGDVPISPPASTEIWVIGIGAHAGLPRPASITSSAYDNLSATLVDYFVDPALTLIAGAPEPSGLRKTLIDAVQGLHSVAALGPAMESEDPVAIGAAYRSAVKDIATLIGQDPGIHASLLQYLGYAVDYAELVLGGTQLFVSSIDLAQEDRTCRLTLDPAYAIGTVTSGAKQNGTAGDALASPIRVRIVAQATGQPVQGAEVSFSTSDGGRFVQSAKPPFVSAGNPARTDADGFAQAYWLLASKAGAQTATVSAPWIRGSPMTVDATAGPATVAASAPIVTTESPSNISANALRMNASVNPSGAATQVHFDWAVSVTLAGASSTQTQNLSSGTSAVSVTQDLSDLGCGTTYYYRVVAVNSAGEKSGSIVSATTSPCPVTAPTVSLTATPSSIVAGQSSLLTWTSSNASLCVGNWATGTGQVALNGSASVTPNATTTYTLLCSGSGTNAPTAHTSTTVNVTMPATPVAPVVTTLAASNVGQTTLRLNGSINPNGSTAQGYFEWSANSGLAPSSSTNPTNIGSSTTSVTISSDLSSLACGTTYYYRAVASASNVATARGSILSAATAACTPVAPVVSLTANPSSITTGQSTTLTWTTSNASLCVGNWASGTGQVSTNGSALVSPANTTTYTILCSGNGANAPTANASATVTVTAPATPTVSTLPASNITPTGFRLNGSINPNGVSTQGYFEWSANSSLNPVSVTAIASVGSGTSPVPISTDLFNAACGATYYYRTVAANANGSVVRGSIVSATTAACAVPTTPTATTLAASNVTSSGFRMNGSVNPNGTATSGYFEWSTSSSLVPKNVTQGVSIGAGTVAVGLSDNSINGVCGTTYYYRAVAVNANSAVGQGAVVSVTTSACPVQAPTVSLSANPSTITAGQSSSLSWSTSNASLCVGSWASGTGQVALSGTASVTPNTTTLYTILCSGIGANAPTANASTTITVNAPSTPTVPTVTTLSASSVGQTTFHLNGSINPNGVSTQGYFEYGQSSSLVPASVSSLVNMGSGTGTIGITDTYVGGRCNTTYYYRTVGVNANGAVVRGSIVSVTTAGCQ